MQRGFVVLKKGLIGAAVPVTKVLSERAVIQTVFQRKLGISGDDPVECGTSPFPVTLH